MSKQAVFLDRDGTLIDDTGFIRRIEDVKLLPRAAQAVKRLNEARWAVIVVSNQSGVARGLLTEKDVDVVNKRMTDLLRAEGATIDAIYYCPHLPEGKVPNYAKVCDCRKPRPGMLLRAAEEHDIDLAHSVMIGDAPRDAEAGLAAGAGAVLITRSATRAEQVPETCQQAVDLFEAVTDVLRNPTKYIAAVKPVEKKNPAEPEAEETEPEAPPASAPVEKTEAPKRPKKRKRRRTSETAVEETPEPASREESEMPTERSEPIPVHTAPKEFTPEPELEANGTPDEGIETEAAPPEKPPAAVELPPPVELPSPVELPPIPPENVTHPCSRCGRVIAAVDIAEGKAYNRDGMHLCETCVTSLLSSRASASRDVANEDVLRELRNITRALTYEKFTFWHILGAIAQAAAIGACIFSFFRPSDATTFIFLAIFLQVLALTFFTLGRD